MAPPAPLIQGDDGLPAEEVGAWAIEKHEYLKRYLNISRAARGKFLGRGKAGATFIDLFCATGRARVRETGQWIDGSAITAWKIAQTGNAAFSQILISDIDPIRRSACAERLRKLGAPVREFGGPAVQTSREVVKVVHPLGLHFAFLDPFNLGELDFSIIKTLSQLKRIDMLIHVSAMDLQRNLERHISSSSSSSGVLDIFAPDWRKSIDLRSSKVAIRQSVIEYWRDQVARLGTDTAKDVILITGGNNQRLYWLLLAAKHDLARKFWGVASNVKKQGDLFS
jgi:three-Cys-motif partner protein